MLHLVVLSAFVALSHAWIPGCGVSKYADAGGLGAPRIVGGQEARANEFPWQVSMKGIFGSHYCGAIVVGSGYVMTAAHCTDGDSASDLRLMLGEHSLSQVDDSQLEVTVSVLRQHEGFSFFTLSNDISLLTLNGIVGLNENIAAVCSPVAGDDYAGQMSVVSGWGTLTSGGSCCPDILRYVQVPVITNVECNSSNYYGGDVDDTMICAGDPFVTDSCQGDSGGPLAVKRNGVFELIGIVSWGIGCASGYPGVYTRVEYFLDWIGILN